MNFLAPIFLFIGITIPIEAELSAYCACDKCCGIETGITASGTVATEGRTIAADERFAFGTEIEINGVTYTVEDRGGAIKGNKIDIYFESHADALEFGRQKQTVYIKNALAEAGTF